MNVIINGETIMRNLDFPPTTTIGSLKTYFGTIADLQNHTVKFLFNNGQELSPVVWTTNQYDNVDFQQYANVLKGGTINITVPPPSDSQKREYLYSHIMGVMDEYIHEWNEEFEEYIDLFPTYDSFARHQRMMLDNANTATLDYWVRLMGDIKNRRVEYVEMNAASPGMALDTFFLIHNKIMIIRIGY